jgi:hypothetical protein
VKVSVALVIDIDPDKWAVSNGQMIHAEDRRARDAEVREDVRSYFLHLVQSSNMLDEVNGTAHLRGQSA